MQIIRDWFNQGRHYEAGVALYESYSPTRALLPMFRQGRSEYRESRLEAELEKMLGEYVEPEKVPAISVPVLPAISAPLPARKDDPYKERWAPLYAEMNFLRHGLLNAESDRARGMMAHKILELEAACEEFWAMRREYDRTGILVQERTLNKPEVMVTTDYNALQKRVGNLRTYISRASHCPEDEKTALKLEKWRAELKTTLKVMADGGY